MSKIYCDYNDYLELTTEFTAYDYTEIMTTLMPDYVVAIVPVNAQVKFYNNRVRIFSEDIKKCHEKAHIIFLQDSDAHIIWHGRSHYINWNGRRYYINIEDITKHFGFGSRKGICIYSRKKALAVGDEYVYHLINTQKESLTFGIIPSWSTIEIATTHIVTQQDLNDMAQLIEEQANRGEYWR